MTKKTLALRDEIINVIRNDATLQYSYFGEKNGAMCVLGGLMHHAGIASSADQLPRTKLYIPNRAPIESDLFAGIAAALYERYGLVTDELGVLQRINDSCKNLEERRSMLVSRVMEFFSDVKE